MKPLNHDADSNPSAAHTAHTVPTDSSSAATPTYSCPCEAYSLAQSSRRAFVKATAVASAVVAVAPGELLNAMMPTDKSKNGQTAGLFTVDFDKYPGLKTVGSTVGIPKADIGQTISGIGLRFFVTRTGTNDFVAVNDVCTHDGCFIDTSGAEFECPCHGSRFTSSGKVTQGPAGSPLRSFATTFAAGSNFVQVDLPGYVPPPPPAPTATATPTTLAFGTIATGETKVLSYSITGANLTAALTVTAPTGFALSTSQSGTFAATLTLQPTNGQLSQTVFVRFAPQQASNFSGSITHVSGGGTLTTVAVSGAGMAASPTAQLSLSTIAFGAITTAMQSERTYQITAENLNASLVVTAPAGFRIRDATANAEFTSSLTFQPSPTGRLLATIIVRFASAQPGTFSGIITHSVSGTSLAGVSVSGTVTMATSVQQTEMASGVQVYPNPTRDEITVRIELLEAAPIELAVVNLLGQELMHFAEPTARKGTYMQRINIAHLPAGTCYVRATVGSQQLMQRFVKQE